MKASEMLNRAAELVSGDREATHGPKLENHKNIASLWSAYLGVGIGPKQVALMMALLKVARTKLGNENIDDYIDLGGYAGVAGEIAMGGGSDLADRPLRVGDRVRDLDGHGATVKEADGRFVRVQWDCQAYSPDNAAWWPQSDFVRIAR